jgi:hypothetical protein
MKKSRLISRASGGRPIFRGRPGKKLNTDGNSATFRWNGQDVLSGNKSGEKDLERIHRPEAAKLECTTPSALSLRMC